MHGDIVERPGLTRLHLVSKPFADHPGAFVGFDRHVDPQGLGEIRRTVDVRQHARAGRQARQHASLRTRADLPLDQLPDVGQFPKDRPIFDRNVPFCRRVSAQKDRVGRHVHALLRVAVLAAPNFPDRMRQSRHFRRQPFGIDLVPEPHASAHQRVLVEKRLIRQVAHLWNVPQCDAEAKSSRSSRFATSRLANRGCVLAPDAASSRRFQRRTIIFSMSVVLHATLHRQRS